MQMRMMVLVPWGHRLAHVRERGRASFLKKRSKRLSFSGHGLDRGRPWPESKSVLVLFFKKEPLSYFLCPCTLCAVRAACAAFACTFSSDRLLRFGGCLVP
jgi:hypothetical protein